MAFRRVIRSLDGLNRWPSIDPIDVAMRWPSEAPLLFLGSGRPHPRWSRWSIVATPARWVVIPQESSSAAAALESDPLAALQRALDSTRLAADHATPLDVPFAGGWIGLLGYELGRALEPAARSPAGRGDSAKPGSSANTWPIVALGWCPHALVHDAATQRWWRVATACDDGEAVRSDNECHAEDKAACVRAGAIVDAVEAAMIDGPTESHAFPPPCGAPPQLPEFTDVTSPRDWCEAVSAVVELIRAGDIFQANLTRQRRGVVHGSPRKLGLEILRAASPWHGALLELPEGRSVVSLSPELFLMGALATALCAGTDAGQQGDAPRAGGSDRRRWILSRPIKGTRAADDDPAELLTSEKDAAELNMIVDLMRNDLGRICEIGSVRVTESRHLERHPTVHQGVATIEGVPRADIDVAAMLRATFPAGSITGAPKIRAMQVIEMLEPAPRGPYCGSIGFFSDSGEFALNVAIRTLVFDAPCGGASQVTYGVGCGIVSDSDPDTEWLESVQKAAIIDLVRERLADEERSRNSTNHPLSHPAPAP